MSDFCSNAGWFGLLSINFLVFLLGWFMGYKPRAVFLLEEKLLEQERIAGIKYANALKQTANDIQKEVEKSIGKKLNNQKVKNG